MFYAIINTVESVLQNFSAEKNAAKRGIKIGLTQSSPTPEKNCGENRPKIFFSLTVHIVSYQIAKIKKKIKMHACGKIFNS